MERRFAVILILLIANLQSFADPIKDYDGKGYVLSFGKFIEGMISVDLNNNDVVIKKDLQITHLPSNKIQKVSVDHKEVYYSGVFGFNNEAILFEAIVDGQLPLLYREGLKFSPYDDHEYSPFFILVNEQVFSLGASKKEIISVFDSHMQNDVGDFIKSEKLDLKKKQDLTKLFSYYNDQIVIQHNIVQQGH